MYERIKQATSFQGARSTDKLQDQYENIITEKKEMNTWKNFLMICIRESCRYVHNLLKTTDEVSKIISQFKNGNALGSGNTCPEFIKLLNIADNV